MIIQQFYDIIYPMKKLIVFGLVLVFVVVSVYIVKISSLQSGKGLQDVRNVPQKEVQQTPAPVGEIPLEVNIPEYVSVPSLAVAGKTVSEAEVFVNELETVSGTDGRFWVNYRLDEGENSIIVVVSDVNGQTTEKELTVTYTPVE